MLKYLRGPVRYVSTTDRDFAHEMFLGCAIEMALVWDPNDLARQAKVLVRTENVNEIVASCSHAGVNSDGVPGKIYLVTDERIPQLMVRLANRFVMVEIMKQ